MRYQNFTCSLPFRFLGLILAMHSIFSPSPTVLRRRVCRMWYHRESPNRVVLKEKYALIRAPICSINYLTSEPSAYVFDKLTVVQALNDGMITHRSSSQCSTPHCCASLFGGPAGVSIHRFDGNNKSAADIEARPVPRKQLSPAVRSMSRNSISVRLGREQEELGDTHMDGWTARLRNSGGSRDCHRRSTVAEAACHACSVHEHFGSIRAKCIGRRRFEKMISSVAISVLPS